MPMITGSLSIANANDQTRNSALYYDASGQLVGAHDKQLLVPFGEYMPLRDTFPQLTKMVPGVGNIYPGEQVTSFNLEGTNILPGICYEAVYPHFTRQASIEPQRADLLLNLTNDVWFGDTSAPELHLMVQAQRAVELRLPLIRSTNSGISAVVDITGEIRSRSPLFETAVIEDVVEIKPVYSFYREAGNVFLFSMMGLCGLWTFIGRRRQG